MSLFALVLIALSVGVGVGSDDGGRAGDGEDVTLVVGGDVALGRVMVQTAGQGGSVGETSARIAPISRGDLVPEVVSLLRAADLALVNLESPLCDRAPVPAGRRDIRLVGRPSAVQTLVGLGVDVVSLANNHALDCGVDGLRLTRDTLARSDIRVVGADPDGAPPRMIVVEAGGLRVAVVAATDRRNRSATTAQLRDHVAWYRSDRLRSELVSDVRNLRKLRALKTKAGVAPFDVGPFDVLIISLHWGAELAVGPDRTQERLARDLVEAGVDIVAGHGSHTVQRAERHRGGVVFYGLGNLVFDMRDPATRERALGRVTFERGGAAGWRLASHELRRWSSTASQ